MRYMLSTRDRVVWVSDPTVTQSAPTSGTTAPHIVLSPKTVGGRPTVGFAMAVNLDYPQQEIDIVKSTFTTLVVRPWKLLRGAQRWAKLASVSISAFGEYIVCFDAFGGDALYFQMTGWTQIGGGLWVSVEERF